jgi:hypothetical protein
MLYYLNDFMKLPYYLCIGKKLIPHSKAAIFIQDFDDDIDRLVTYLNYLLGNETAYEEHRDWRKTFDM